MRVARVLLFAYPLAVAVGVAEARAQTDPENVPEPPVEQLAKLQPFVGLYVEFVINTHHRAIDRQLRMIMTWDDALQHYRVWRFATLPQQAPGAVEGKARFVADTLVMQWENMRSPQGLPATFRNRVFMDGPDELVIISDGLPEGASEWIRIGELRSRRRI